MKTKSKAKPTAKPKNLAKTVKAVPMMEMKQPKRASVEKAEGGFIVSKGYGEKQHVVKDMKEAHKVLEKLLK
jgi:hypothetical protein